MRFQVGHFRKSHGIHQPIDPSNDDRLLVLNQKAFCDFISPQTFLRRIDVQDLRTKHGILLRTRRRSHLEMFVIRTAVDVEDSTKSLDGMFKAQAEEVECTVKTFRKTRKRTNVCKNLVFFFCFVIID